MQVADRGAAWNGNFATEVEEVVLNALKGFADRGREVFGEQQAYSRIQLIDIAQRLDARAFLGDPRAVAEAGLAGVAGASVDLGEAVAHGRELLAPGRAGQKL